MERKELRGLESAGICLVYAGIALTVGGIYAVRNTRRAIARNRQRYLNEWARWRPLIIAESDPDADGAGPVKLKLPFEEGEAH